jgi:O-antigen/teichoic acid export membrane protein
MTSNVCSLESQRVEASNTKKIASNAIWYGADQAISLLLAFGTSIALARVLGPQKLGYFNYIMWLSNMTGSIGSLGVPLAVGKYVAEYLGAGRPDVARGVFYRGLRHQCVYLQRPLRQEL